MEIGTFLHELMHHYEFRLRLACWHENQGIDGFILQESWLRAYDADRLRLEQLGLPLLQEPSMPDIRRARTSSRARNPGMVRNGLLYARSLGTQLASVRHF